MNFLAVSLGYHPDVIGGAWRVAAAQASGLAALGHQVEVITAHQGGDLPPSEVRDGVRLFRFPQSRGGFYANWRAENRAAADLIRQRLEHLGPSCLILQHHAFLAPALDQALPAATTSPAPRILHTFHGPWAEEYRFVARAHPASVLRRLFHRTVATFLHRVEHRALHRANRLLVLSRHFAGLLPKWHGSRLPPVSVAPGGVDFDRFRPPPDREAIRLSWGLEPDAFLMVAMRRLDPRMGLDLLIRAFAPLASRFPHVRLWITGRGPAEDALRGLIKEHGLGEQVRLPGFLPENEVPRLLGAADVALMPSLDLEGFGLATAEALACGTPVLGSRAGATPELLEPLDPGLVFDAGSAAVLTTRLQSVLRTPACLPDRARCAAYARARFSWEPQVAACENAARELLRPA